MILRALVVDDEEWTCLGIVSKLKKSGLHFESIDYAQNASEALLKAEKIIPNIAICDIRMDDVNGLELSRRLIKRIPGIKIIIISGYNEFSYAQEAIQIGIVDYILKPVDAPALYKALDKCIQLISKEDQSCHALGLLESVRKCKEFYALVQEMQEQPSPNFKILFSDFSSSFQFVSVYLYLDACFNLPIESLCEWLRKDLPAFVLGKNSIYYEILRGEFIFFLCVPPEKGDWASSSLTDSLTRLLTERFENISVYQYTFGISDILPDMRQAQKQSMHNMKHRLLCHRKDQIRSADIAPYHVAQPLSRNILSDLTCALKHQDSTLACKSLESMYLEMDKEHISYDSLQSLYLCILILIGENVDCGLNWFSGWPREIYVFSSIWDFVDFLKEIFQDLILTAQKSITAEDFHLKTVEYVCRYIQQNFSKEISLRELSEQQNINYCYLSFLFRDVMKTTFQDYLIEIRLEQARKLLRKPGYKIKDVAELVGFHNQHYFSKVFKKRMGCSPREFQSGYSSEQGGTDPASLSSSL